MYPVHAHCPLCGSAETGVLGEEYRHAYLVQCQQCGLVYGERIPSLQELNDHYGKYPRNTSISPLTIKRYEELLEQFEPYRRTNRLLDVGCGDGHFLEVAKRKGWTVYGTEYTSEAVNVGRAKGIEMHEGLIQSFTAAGEFDVITSFEVLEHITDGNEHAAAIARLLRKGGLFYFTTPNFNALSRKWLGGKWKIIEYPEHLTYYTAQTAEKLLVKAGLQRLQIISTGITLRQFPSGENHYASSEEQLRNSIESSGSLRLLKSFINYWLTLLNLGDSLKGYFVKAGAKDDSPSA
jgi:2-polyprenyl-3-methyl-5-hydroxy-6-metoxy-1,4-benzoquinol methylase